MSLCKLAEGSKNVDCTIYKNMAFVHINDFGKKKSVRLTILEFEHLVNLKEQVESFINKTFIIYYLICIKFITFSYLYHFLCRHAYSYIYTIYYVDMFILRFVTK